jgi:hypothetical protein
MAGAGQWLLDLTIGGRLYRYSTRRVEVTDASGRVLLYQGGLADFEIEDQGNLEEQGVQITDYAADWAGLAARGISIVGAAAVLRWWRSDDLFERARTVLSGVFRDPELGDPAAMGQLVATIAAVTGTDTYWAQQSQVGLATWIYEPTGDAIYDDTIEGAVYPIVFGYPGYHESANPNEGTGPAVGFLLIPAVPALLVRYDGTTGLGGSALVVAMGPTEASRNFLRAGIGTVRVYCPDIDGGTFFGFAYEALNVKERADLLGQTVSYIEFGVDTIPDPHPIQPFLAFKYYTAWGPPEFDGTDHAGGGTIFPGPSAGAGRAGSSTAAPRPIRTLTDVAVFVLRNSGRAVDIKAQEAERDRLDSYAVDGFVNSSVQWVPWFEQNLGKLFPIVRRSGPRGIYYAFVNWWARSTDAVAVLVAGNNGVQRVSALKTSSFASIRNRFTLDFARNALDGAYTARMILGPEAGVLDPALELDGRVVGSPRCAASAASYGLAEADPVESPFVWSDQQAVGVLEHWAQRDSELHWFVSYTGPDFGDLRTGQVVTITDDEVGLDRAVALVNGIVLSGSRLLQVNLEIIARPFRATA